MEYRVSFNVDATAYQRKLLEAKIKQALESIGLEPEDLFVTIKWQQDFIPAVPPAGYSDDLK